MSFAQVIDLWPRYMDLAEDCGVAKQTVASWHRRSSIPQHRWECVERSAQHFLIHGITYDYLRSIAAHHSPATRVPPRRVTRGAQM
ncbi:MAG TPA: hypothetical protein VNT29_07475 [Candidatus Limnocylindrales bacterium]|nr:hypothetical protein [Candidatus Limnocylindrales bacterium]